MTFGPFLLKDVRTSGDSLVLDLADSTGVVMYSPRRKLSYSQTKEATQQAERLKGKMVTTETYDPVKYPTTRWWLSVKVYEQATVDVPKQRTKVVGPPGTGKTHTLIEYVKEHVTMGVQTDRIAFLTFTNNAAAEARKRVLEAFSEKSLMDFPHFSTLHSLATQLGGLIGNSILDSDKLRKFDPNISKDVVWMRQGDASSAEERPDHAPLALQSFSRARCITLEEAVGEGGFEDLNKPEFNKVLQDFFKIQRSQNVRAKGFDLVKMYLDEYNRFKQENRFADFDDVIDNAQSDSFIKHIRAFDLLIIDEAQDLSDLQWKFVNRLIAQAKRVIVAGDDDQAIMIPFGASPSAFLKFEGEEKTLRQSRRVPQVAYDYVMKHTMPILKQQFPDRLEKDWLPTAEAGRVETELEKIVRVPKESGGQSVPTTVMAQIKLQDLLYKVKAAMNEEWLIMAPTKRTCEDISIGLKEMGVPHFIRNRPVLDADKTASAIRIMSIHTSKGDEADNAALVLSSRGDMKMVDNDPRLRYVAQTRAKKVLYPEVRAHD